MIKNDRHLMENSIGTIVTIGPMKTLIGTGQSITKGVGVLWYGAALEMGTLLGHIFSMKMSIGSLIYV